MAKYTDEQIKNALECCYRGFSCMDSCPFDDRDDDCSNCTSLLSKAAFDLINRQEAEKAELQREIASYKSEIERLQGKVEMYEEERKYHFAMSRKKIAKAIKEFAERLCEGRVSNDPVVIAVKCKLKEMVGESK